MKLSTLWLRQWVNISITEQELAHQLTMAGLEVDAVIPVAGDFTEVVVAQVLNTKPHPNADKLTLCEVNDGTTVLNIVCGAANVRPNLKVALAKIGAKLPGGFTIKESKLRGELSQGMLCSISELGMAESSDGIMELEADAPIGKSLREYLNLDDFVLDIDLTPNRADCFSMLGVAREVAILNKKPLTEPHIVAIPPKIDDTLRVKLENAKACPHYCGRIVRNINPQAQTPLWMTERLGRSGIRTVHPVVDIMNYVMLELGQPMHAFDLTKIKGSIQVRNGKSTETLDLLDGQKVNLAPEVLVIADDEKPLAMAGIMGGEESAVGCETTDVFLESAYFNPLAIAGVARTYGLFSDSSQRFERGVDPSIQIKALERATALILEISQGEAGPIIEVADNTHLPKPITLDFNTQKVEQITGLKLSGSDMKQWLEGLGMKLTAKTPNLFEVQVPPHRFDIQLEVDLVEEIVRLYGYDKLKAKPISATLQSGQLSFEQQTASMLANWFRDKNYQETISYSFVDPMLQSALYPEHEVMELLNPISPDLSQMRLGLWPGLIASMIYNAHRQQASMRLFEIGVVFNVKHKTLTEKTCIAGLLMGNQGAADWSTKTHSFDFYDLKGDLEALFSLLKLKATFVAKPHPSLHPGQSAQIVINNQPAGWLGVLHPRLNEELELASEVVLFELDMKSLVNSCPQTYKTISKYPKIRRDLSFLVEEKVEVQAIEIAVRKTIKEDWLKSFEVFDVYQGDNIPQGKKSLAIALTLQAENKTLVESEVSSLISAIINTLEQQFSILMRD